MNRITVFAGVATAALLVAGPASGGIIWDYSPATTGATLTPPLPTGTWVNDSTGQNFAEQVLFPTGAALSGIDIYSTEDKGEVGDNVVVRIWSDNSGLPDSLLLSLPTVITAVDGAGATPSNIRMHADLSYFFAPGTTYWIGMSGDGFNLGQKGLLDVEDSRMAWFNGTTFLRFTQTPPIPPGASYPGDMAFRLEGELGPVPEPATLLLLGSGLLGLLGLRRRS